MRGLLLLIALGTLAGCGCGRTDITGETDASDEESVDPGPDTSVPDLEPEEPSPECGNGIIEEDEACDGGALGGMTCEDLGYDGGILSCTSDCAFDEGTCEYVPDCVRYVDIDTMAPSPDGMSWETAMPTVQEGIDLVARVATEEDPCEVWVAEGTYYIYQMDKYDTVQLERNVSLYGGFSGAERVRGDRDWVRHETRLSGHTEPEEDGGVCHVVTAMSDDTPPPLDSVFDGFIVEEGGGFPPGDEGCSISTFHSGGGGMIISYTSPTVRNCTFRNNSSSDYGGGGAIAIGNDSHPIIENCIFEANEAFWIGGAVLCLDGARPTISNCYFSGNMADNHSGALGCLRDGSPTIRNCTFEANHSLGPGGAVGLGPWSTGVIENCVFSHNSSRSYGAALVLNDTTVTMNNSTIAYNTSEEPGVIYITDGASFTGTNIIVWGNASCSVFIVDGSVDMTFSDVEGGWPGEGNIVQDPLFMDPSYSNYRLWAGSPCIDAADSDESPPTDIEGNPRYDDPDTPNTGVGSPRYVDMGAYEYRP